MFDLPVYIEELTTPFDVRHYQYVYEHSQYCTPRCEFLGNIGDPELYTLAGYHYVSGTPPQLINPELQPLTKYTFGLSTLLTGNALPAQLIYGILTLALLYLLSRRHLPRLVAVVPPLLLLLDPLFLDQLKHPFLDLSLTFWLLALMHYLSRPPTRFHFIWGGLTLGALALAKSFTFGILGLVLAALYHLVTRSPRGLFRLTQLSLVAATTYLLGYVMLFVNGGSLWDLLLLHYDTLKLYRGYVPEYPKGEIFRLIFRAEWLTWWGEKAVIPSPFYSYLWPISSLASITVVLFRRYRSQLRLHLIWIFLSLGFVSLRLMFPRYLLPTLPSLYLVLTSTLYAIIQSCRSAYFPSTSKPTGT